MKETHYDGLSVICAFYRRQCISPSQRLSKLLFHLGLELLTESALDSHAAPEMFVMRLKLMSRDVLKVQKSLPQLQLHQNQLLQAVSITIKCLRY